MLPRSQRLSTAQFKVVMEKGRIVHSPFFQLRLFPIEGNTAIATVASQKICKTAVERNKLRRKMYEAIGSFYKTIKDDMNIIVFAKAGSQSIDFSEFAKEMHSVFVKAGLLK